MSMIFDSFDSMDAAREFVAAVHERFGLDGQTFASAEAAHEDWYRSGRCPPSPTSTAPRFGCDDFLATEAAVEELVGEFGGEWAGT
jgi:hypothetical protein